MNLGALYRSHGLDAVRTALVAQYPELLARFRDQVDATLGDIKVATLIGAICTGDQDTAVAIAAGFAPNVPALAPLRLSPMVRLADYCRVRGLRHKVVLPPQKVKIAPSSPYTMPFAYMTEPAVFASVPGAQYIPGWDFVIGKDGSILQDTGYLPPDTATHDFITLRVDKLGSLIHYSPADEEFIDEDVLFLSTPNNNVGHWMIDFLPRLKGLNYVPGGKVRVVVPRNMHPRYLEMLKVFGLADADMIFCEPHRRYRFRTCHIYKPGLATPPNPIHVQFVREGFVGGQALKIRPGKRVFLARTRIGTRLVANDAEFQDFLKREGILSADPADLSVAEQHDLLNDAEVILGTFGSNLFGMYMAPPGCTVVALMNDVTEDLTVAPTAHMLGQYHQIFLCDRAPESGVKRHKRDTNVVIDCAALSERLAEITRR